MEKCCKDCRHFSDAHYNRTYVSPVCIAHGGDDASFFRQYICGIDKARLFEAKPSSLPAHNESARPD
jgi:hypothetical protein